jgi:hypothetical protein
VTGSAASCSASSAAELSLAGAELDDGHAAVLAELDRYLEPL